MLFNLIGAMDNVQTFFILTAVNVYESKLVLFMQLISYAGPRKLRKIPLCIFSASIEIKLKCCDSF
jgi:hypothetical protein